MRFLYSKNRIYGGCPLRAILSKEPPKRGEGERNQMLFLGKEGGSRGGPILTKDCPREGM